MGDLLDELDGRGEGEALGELLAELLRQVSHLVERGGVLLEEPLLELLRAERGLSEFGDEADDVVMGERADVAQAI